MNLTLESILVFYDEPQVFSSIDEFGVRYISVLVSDSHYLTIKPKQSDFASFLASKTDLLSLIQKSKEFWIIETLFETEHFNAIEFKKPLQANWLPKEGFILAPVSAEELYLEARATSTCLANFGINAEEAKETPQIYVQRFSHAMSHIEEIFSAIYSSMREIGTQKAWKAEAPRLLFTGYAHGSFKAKLKSDELPNLFQESKTEAVWSAFESLTEIVQSNDKAKLKSVLEKNPKIAAALLQLSKFVTSDSTFYIEWASPRRYSPKLVYSQNMGSFIFNTLSEASIVSEKNQTYTGVFTKVNIVKNTWTLKAEKETINGKVEPGLVDLNGITVGSKKYKIECKIIEKFIFSQENLSEERFLLATPTEEN